MLQIFILTALRNIKRQFTLSSIKIIGLTIGTLCFLFTYLFYLHEFSYDQFPKADRIYRYVHRVNLPEGMQTYAVTNALTGQALINEFREIESSCRLLQRNLPIRNENGDISFNETRALFADSTFLEFFPFELELQKQTSGLLKKPFTVILSPTAAKKYFGNENPVGKTILAFDNIALEIEGVFAHNFNKTHLGKTDFVVSFATLESIGKNPNWSRYIPASLNLNVKGFNGFHTYFLLAADANPKTIVEQFPAFIEKFRGPGRSERLKPTLQSLSSIHLESNLNYELDQNGNKTAANIFLLIGVVILIISNMNFINLSTSEFIRRAKSIGIQKLLGTSRFSLILSFLVETFIVCSISVCLSVIILFVLKGEFDLLVNRQLEIELVKIIRLILVLLFMVSLLSGLYPAIFITRVRPVQIIKGKKIMGSSFGIVKNSLVLFQLSISFALVTSAIVIYNQLDYLLNKNLGFNSEKLLQINTAGLSQNEIRDVKTEISRLRGINKVTSTSTTLGVTGFSYGVSLPESGDEERRYQAIGHFVDENFLETLQIDLVSGRFLDESIGADSTENIVINERASKVIFDGNAMNRQLIIPSTDGTGGSLTMTVVGVIKDFHHSSLHNEIEPLLLMHRPRQFMNILVRFETTNNEELISSLEKEWKKIIPHKPFDYTFMDENLAHVYEDEKQSRDLIVAFAMIAIGIASIGLFGMALFMAEQRTKEFGIRKVLGAGTFQLQYIFSKPLYPLISVSFIVGSALAYYYSTRWLQQYPFKVEISPFHFIISLVTISLVMLLTLVYHFVKMAKVNPVDILKDQ
jgi:putative ABC transport system permease protein